MTRETASTPSMSARCSLLVLLASGVLCAPAQAQQTHRSDPIRAMLGAAGLRANRGPMPAFVTRTRPAPGSLHYIPVGGARPEPSGKPLTRDQIRAEEAGLAAVRARDDRLSGHKPVGVIALSAAGEPPVPKKKRVKPCVLTCRINLTGIGRRSSMR